MEFGSRMADLFKVWPVRDLSGRKFRAGLPMPRDPNQVLSRQMKLLNGTEILVEQWGGKPTTREYDCIVTVTNGRTDYSVDSSGEAQPVGRDFRFRIAHSPDGTSVTTLGDGEPRPVDSLELGALDLALIGVENTFYRPRRPVS
jgi:hypothetical protein